MIIVQIWDTQEVPLTIATNFTYSKDVYKDRAMHSKSNNIEYMIYDNANESVDIIF